MDGIRTAWIKDSVLGHWPILYPIPLPSNPWGVMHVLKGTPLEAEIPIVPKHLLDDALRGRCKPLLSRLGTRPSQRSVRISRQLPMACSERVCTLRTEHCAFGSRKLPECYVAPHPNPATATIIRLIAFAWAEDRYVFVVDESLY